jgi:hypothetical protein
MELEVKETCYGDLRTTTHIAKVRETAEGAEGGQVRYDIA